MMDQQKMSAAPDIPASKLDCGGVLRLRDAIIEFAAKDYRNVHRQLLRADSDRKRNKLILRKMELEAFFHSEWYQTLTDIDGDRLMKDIRKYVHMEERERAETRLSRAKERVLEKQNKRMQKGDI